MTTYVYDNVEVEKTGRTANRVLKSGKADELVEITPINSTVGTWKKWVRESAMFAVEDVEVANEEEDE